MDTNSIASRSSKVSKILSRFKIFPKDDKSHPENEKNNDRDKYSLRLRESFSSEAKSVRSKLISSFTSGKEDNYAYEIEFMIDLANSAFASLNSMRCDDRELYEAVNSLICAGCINSEAKKELVEDDILRVRAVRADLELILAETKLSEARAEMTALEEKLAKANAVVDALRAKSHALRVDLKALNVKLKTPTELKEAKRVVQSSLNWIRFGKTQLSALRQNCNDVDCNY